MPHINPDWDRKCAVISDMVRELNDLCGFDPKYRIDQPNAPRITFGYIGNVDANGRNDFRVWSVFLPHPHRVGREEDRIGAFATYDTKGAGECIRSLRAVVRTLRMMREVGLVPTV